MQGNPEFNIGACPLCKHETDMNVRLNTKDVEKAETIVKQMIEQKNIEIFTNELCEECSRKLKL